MTTDLAEHKDNVRMLWTILANKFANLGKVGKRILPCKLITMIQEETGSKSNSTTVNRIELELKLFSKRKLHIRWLFLQILPNIQEIFHKFFNIKWNIYPNSFYKACRMNIDTKTWQEQHKMGKLQANVTDEHRCKI